MKIFEISTWQQNRQLFESLCRLNLPVTIMRLRGDHEHIMRAVSRLRTLPLDERADRGVSRCTLRETRFSVAEAPGRGRQFDTTRASDESVTAAIGKRLWEERRPSTIHRLLYNYPVLKREAWPGQSMHPRGSYTWLLFMLKLPLNPLCNVSLPLSLMKIGSGHKKFRLLEASNWPCSTALAISSVS